MEKRNVRIFLDDIRMPSEVQNYSSAPIYKLKNGEWNIVRDYDEFVEFIEENGIPDVVSFDHDLADIHYKSMNNTLDINYEEGFTEKTGFHCAKWLIERCLDKNIDIPNEIYIHSMNIIGSQNIKSLFDSYQKIKKI